MKSSVSVVAAPSDMSVPRVDEPVGPVRQLRDGPGRGRPRRSAPASVGSRGCPRASSSRGAARCASRAGCGPRGSGAPRARCRRTPRAARDRARCPPVSRRMYASASSRLSSMPASAITWFPGSHTPPPDTAVVPPSMSAFSRISTSAPPSCASVAAVSAAPPDPTTTTSTTRSQAPGSPLICHPWFATGSGPG